MFIRWWRHWVMKSVGGAKIPWSASCKILAITTGFITRWTSKNQILTLIFTLYFWVISVHKLLWLGETCVNYAAQKSFQPTCSAITLNSRCHDLTSIEHYFDQLRPLFIHNGNIMMINWPSSVYETSWSEMVHLRKVSGKCKYSEIKDIFKVLV